jgi:hypothetical protein
MLCRVKETQKKRKEKQKTMSMFQSSDDLIARPYRNKYDLPVLLGMDSLSSCTLQRISRISIFRTHDLKLELKLTKHADAEEVHWHRHRQLACIRHALSAGQAGNLGGVMRPAAEQKEKRYPKQRILFK